MTARGPALVLTPVRRVPVREHGVPRALAMTGDSTLWAIFAAPGHLGRVDESGGFEVDTAAPVGILSLTVRHDTLFAARAYDLWRRDPGGAFHRIAALPDTLRGSITSIAVHQNTWYAVLWRARTATLMVAPRGAPGMAQAQWSPLPDAAAVQVDETGRPILTLLRTPYRVLRQSLDHRVEWSAQPSDRPSEASSRLPLPGTAMSLPSLVLDSGRILQVLTNLKSDTRWLVVYHPGSDTLPQRIRRLATPLGLVQSDPHRRILLGFDDSPARGDIVLFRWRWE